MKFPTTLYKYVGEDLVLQNMLYQRLAEFCAGKGTSATKETWPPESEKWKYELDDEEIFAISVADYLQPPHIQTVLKKAVHPRSSGGIPEIIWRGTMESFEKEFQEVTKK